MYVMSPTEKQHAPPNLPMPFLLILSTIATASAGFAIVFLVGEISSDIHYHVVPTLENDYHYRFLAKTVQLLTAVLCIIEVVSLRRAWVGLWRQYHVAHGHPSDQDQVEGDTWPPTVPRNPSIMPPQEYRQVETGRLSSVKTALLIAMGLVCFLLPADDPVAALVSAGVASVLSVVSVRFKRAATAYTMEAN